MGILIWQSSIGTPQSENVSQSPKAGHGYSDQEHQMKETLSQIESLNPLKRVMGILIDPESADRP